MRATQARFDRVARGELQRPAYTVEQMLNWTETDLNWHMRRALQAHGFRTFHIREASETGVADLIVYSPMRVDLPPGHAIVKPEGERVITHSCVLQSIDCWIELKRDNDKTAYIRDERKASQRQFMRDHWNVGRNAIYVMMDHKVGMLAAHQGDLKGRVKMLPMSPYSVDWPAVFAHFKARR